MRRYNNLASASSYHAMPDDAAWSIHPTTEPIIIESPVDVSDILADERPARTNRGQFKKGFDPRRNRFTTETARTAFEQACLSVDERFPDARCRHNAALSHCLLRAKRPEFFEARQSERRAA